MTLHELDVFIEIDYLPTVYVCIKFEGIPLKRSKDMTKKKCITTSFCFRLLGHSHNTQPIGSTLVIRRAVTAALLLYLSGNFGTFLTISCKFCGHYISKTIHPIIMKFHRLMCHDKNQSWQKFHCDHSTVTLSRRHFVILQTHLSTLITLQWTVLETSNYFQSIEHRLGYNFVPASSERLEVIFRVKSTPKVGSFLKI